MATTTLPVETGFPGGWQRSPRRSRKCQWSRRTCTLTTCTRPKNSFQPDRFALRNLAGDRR